ncbi:MAG: hypothetical protein ACPLXS_03135 [Candidatus Micrarchaeales archaeon]
MEKQKIRAQSAVEFLLTYGWGILIISIAIIAIASSPLFSNPFYSRYCYISPGFGCSQFLINSSGNLSIMVIQATGMNVNITRIACSTFVASPLPSSSQWINVNIPLITGTSKRINFPCFVGSSTTPFKPALGSIATVGAWLSVNVPGQSSPIIVKAIVSTVVT